MKSAPVHPSPLAALHLPARPVNLTSSQSCGFVWPGSGEQGMGEYSADWDYLLAMGQGVARG